MIKNLDSFKYILGNNDRVKCFILSVYGQDGNTISDLADYIIYTQFTINKKKLSRQIIKIIN